MPLMLRFPTLYKANVRLYMKRVNVLVKMRKSCKVFFDWKFMNDNIIHVKLIKEILEL